MLGAAAVLALGASSASAITIDFGVATIGGTISFTGTSLQAATALNLDGASLEVARLGPGDMSGLAVGDLISITPPLVSFPGDVLAAPITKSWTDSLGTFDETLTSVLSVDRSETNALTMILQGTLTGPGIATSQPAFLEYAATEVDGPGGAISLSLTDASKMPGGVPEPSTWAMMLLGFSGLGFAGYLASRKSIRAYGVSESGWIWRILGSSLPQTMLTAAPLVGGNKLPFDDNKC